MRKGNILIPALIALLAVGAFVLVLNSAIQPVPVQPISKVVKKSFNKNTNRETIAANDPSNTNAVGNTSNTNVSGAPVENANTNTNVVGVTSSTPTGEDLTNTNPTVELDNKTIKKVTDISHLFEITGEDGFQAVSVKGNTAVLGGSGSHKLYFYDGKEAVDITSNVASSDPATNAKQLLIGPIENNGSYWLIMTTRVGGPGHLYKFDGTNWTDLSNALQTAAPRTVFGGGSIGWNGTFWLIGSNPGYLVTYDGQTFTNITAQVPNPEKNQTYMDIAWNDAYFLFLMLSTGNHGRLYKYDGQVITQVEGIDANNNLTTVGWNGQYWLLAGFNNQHVLRYDGTSFRDVGIVNYQQARIAWVKNKWLLSERLFDGEKLDEEVLFDVGYRVNGISVGDKYGILLGQNKKVYQFDI